MTAAALAPPSPPLMPSVVAVADASEPHARHTCTPPAAPPSRAQSHHGAVASQSRAWAVATAALGAPSGWAALWEGQADEKFNPEEYDIVFIDWNMPKMNGLEFIAAAFQKAPFSSFPMRAWWNAADRQVGVGVLVVVVGVRWRGTGRHCRVRLIGNVLVAHRMRNAVLADVGRADRPPGVAVCAAACVSRTQVGGTPSADGDVRRATDAHARRAVVVTVNHDGLLAGVAPLYA